MLLYKMPSFPLFLSSSFLSCPMFTKEIPSSHMETDRNADFAVEAINPFDTDQYTSSLAIPKLRRELSLLCHEVRDSLISYV